MKRDIEHTDERPFFNETQQTEYVSRSEFDSTISEVKSAVFWGSVIFAILIYFYK